MITIWVAFYVGHLLGLPNDHLWYNFPFFITAFCMLFGEIFLYSLIVAYVDNRQRRN